MAIKLTSTVRSSCRRIVSAMLLIPLAFLRAENGRSQTDCKQLAQSERSYNTFFGRQVPVVGESRQWRIELLNRVPSHACAGSYEFHFRAINKPDKTSEEFTLCNETEQVDEVDVINQTRVLLLGRLAANAAIASVVEIPSGNVVDSFTCFMPAISPTHRFLAFLKSFPGHPGPVEISAAYLVYDLTLSPAANRIRSGSQMSDAGLAVYPPDATNAPGANIRPQGSPYHSWASHGLFWTSDTQFVFADLFQGDNNLVQIDLSRGVRNPGVHTAVLDSSTLVDLTQCKQMYSESEFESLSQQPAGLLHISEVKSVKPGWLCIQFAQNPCLKSANLVIQLP